MGKILFKEKERGTRQLSGTMRKKKNILSEETESWRVAEVMETIVIGIPGCEATCIRNENHSVWLGQLHY